MIRGFGDVGGSVREIADVAIVGSGAGGAVLAKELAERGRSVVVLEEGRHWTARDFGSRTYGSMRRLYRDMGVTGALGQPTIPIAVGRCVGGSTVVNGGTCWRTPDRVLDRWALEYGLRDAGPADMKPYFDRVEEILGVRPVPDEFQGGNNRVFRRGVEALGWSGGPVRRNDRGCRGSGNCAFGCPNDGKQSMLVSYLPRAVAAGAKVLSECKVDRILVERGRAVGLSGRMVDAETGEVGPPVEVRAAVTAVCGGGMHTAGLLLANRASNLHGQVGRGFMLHPCAKVMALLDESVRGWEGVVQGWYLDEFADEGLLVMTAFAPPELAALSLPTMGRETQAILANFDRIAIAGVLVSDTSRGRVRLGPGGMPLVTYRLNRLDTERLVRGIAITARIFFAAGARRVWPAVHGVPVLESAADIRKLYEHRVRPSDLEVVSLHPMGACRMGEDPTRSVVDSFGESHEVRGLFVTDGSIFPSSLGVNPQISIMAFATRAADYLEANAARYFA